ncbi:hypothetical protein BGW41_000361 [Actinomortierella wolfii]|nr:hypothetical protein BGW41_000361 [Actinomortierella wolfii]
MSAHAASTLSSANQWPISNTNLDNHRSTARGVLSTGGSVNDPAFEAQVARGIQPMQRLEAQASGEEKKHERVDTKALLVELHKPFGPAAMALDRMWNYPAVPERKMTWLLDLTEEEV